MIRPFDKIAFMYDYKNINAMFLLDSHYSPIYLIYSTSRNNVLISLSYFNILASKRITNVHKSSMKFIYTKSA